jgi:Putative capsular polysaccharide synthesis protein
MFYQFRRKIIKRIKRIILIERINEKINFTFFHLKAKRIPPVFVYQMGKVASSSIYRSIKTEYKGLSLHAHSFTKDHVKPSVRYLYEINKKEKIPIKIISLIREPIGRNISAFYENFKRDLGINFEDNPYTTIELHKLFLKDHDHNIPLIWFDHNLLNNFNIDVYQQPFPEIGYTAYRNENVDLLLMKHNLDNKIKEEVVGEFLNIKNFKLINYNVASSKIYFDSYREFQQLPIPDWYISKMIDSKYVKHFYSSEIDDIINKWSIKNLNK